jgi:dTDP-glucose 4,6-dehydratase
VYAAINGHRYKVHRGHTRTHTFIDDAVEWIARINDKFEAGKVYNIAGSHRTDVETISSTILKVLERDDSIVDYADPEPMTTKDKIVDNSRMLRDLGTLAETTFEEGIRRTINWQRQVYGL